MIIMVKKPVPWMLWVIGGIGKSVLKIEKSLHERVGETNEIPCILSDNLIELAEFELAPNRIRPEMN